MPLSAEQQQKIKTLLADKMASKLDSYGRETTAMPFLSRLIQDNEKIAAYSFIHSLATSLGMSIYEEVSVIIASDTAEAAKRNYRVGGSLSSAQHEGITKIVSGLRDGSRIASITNETQEILAADASGGQPQSRVTLPTFIWCATGASIILKLKPLNPI